jgi:hypothetical protein
MRKSLFCGLIGACLLSGTAAAQGPVVLPTAPLGPGSTVDAIAGKTGQGTQSVISGTAVDANTSPLPNVTVRLRNLETNLVEQVSKANSIGEFTFVAQPNIPYIVEITDQLGNILAVGDIVTAQVGDVAGAVVALPTRIPALAGVFKETMGSVVSAATGTGLTVVDAAVVPVLSPEK